MTIRPAKGHVIIWRMRCPGCRAAGQLVIDYQAGLWRFTFDRNDSVEVPMQAIHDRHGWTEHGGSWAEIRAVLKRACFAGQIEAAS